MAVFTTTEANAAVVTRCEAVTNGGTHRHYCISAKHASYEAVEWCDSDTAADATPATLQAAIVARLKTIEKTATVVRDSFDGVTDTAGDLVAGQIVSNIS